MSMRNRGSHLGAKSDVRFPRLDGPANSAVTSYILTPEELAELNAKLQPKPIPTWETKPLNHPTKQQREAYHMSKLTKEQYLTKRHEGMTKADIAREAGINPNYIYELLKRWKIDDPNAELQAIRALYGVELKGSKVEKEEPKVIEEVDLKQTGLVAEISDEAKDALIAWAKDRYANEEIPQPVTISQPIERSVTLNVTITERIILESLRAMQEAVHETAVSKGWYEPAPTFPTQIALIHSELSEAMEADRKGHGSEKVAEELADVVIRVMDTAQSHGLDLAQAILAKNEKNRAREHRHGGLAY